MMGRSPRVVRIQPPLMDVPSPLTGGFGLSFFLLLLLLGVGVSMSTAQAPQTDHPGRLHRQTPHPSNEVEFAGRA